MLTTLKPAPFRPDKPLMATWNSWRKGLNLLLRETEIDGGELVTATNLLLTGSGVPTKRWGSQTYFQAATNQAAGYIMDDTSLTMNSPSDQTISNYAGRFLLPIKDATDNIQVLAQTDWGYMVKQSGTSFTRLTGASWPTGYNTEGIVLGGNVYFVNQQKPLVKYDFSNLISFNSLSIPTGVAASNLSGATGTTTYGWRVTATSKTGETIASTEVSLASLPQNLNNTLIRVSWAPVSAASGDLTGYNVYRGLQGQEAWVGGVPAGTTKFDDNGLPAADPTHTAPLADSTSGPTAKYIIRFQDRMIVAGIPGSPTKVLISGRYPYHERFDTFSGGASLLLEPDSGEDITGLGIYYRSQTSTQTVVVFKERSVWEVSLDTSITGANNFAVLVPSYRLLTASQGCSSHRSIVAVENDIMFANSRGIYILRYEPQLLNVINANEISAKIRPFFEGLSYADITGATGVYADKKYVLSFPSSKQSICFDRERLSFTGPWKTPFSINKWSTYVDATGTERWIAIPSDSSIVREFSKGFSDDSGTAIATAFKTKKEDFGDWTLYKTLSEVYMNFRNVIGTAQVNIYIEDRTGQVTSAKTFTLTGASSLGSTGMGTLQLGEDAEIGLANGNSQFIAGELQKKAILYKTTRTMQVEILTSGQTDNYELLNIKGVGIPQARGNSPTTWNV